MHLRRPAFLLLASLLCASGAPLLLAQNAGRTAEASLFLPYTIYDVELEGGTQLDEDLGWGVRFGYNFTDRFEAEGFFFRTDTRAPVGDEDRNATAESFGLDFLGNFRPKSPRHRPYFACGIGRMKLTVDRNDSTDTDFDDSAQFLGLGGGYRYFFKPWLAFRLDGRLLLSNQEGSFLSGLTESLSYDVSWQGSVGISFVFPRPYNHAPSEKPPAPPSGQ